MGELLTVENLWAFLTLTSLEIVLGIDNVIFIAILAAKLEPSQRDRGRQFGLMIAVVSRILLLLALGWVLQLKKPLFTFLETEYTGKDLVLIFGGLFLIFKATYEIHHKVNPHRESATGGPRAPASLSVMLAQVAIIDIVFSLDSVITAVGMVKHIAIMVAAILVAVGVMLAFSGYIVAFIERHPAIKILALSFLLLIGVLLVAEGFEQHVDKNYVYFAMAFSLMVELLEMRADKKAAEFAGHGVGPAGDPPAAH